MRWFCLAFSSVLVLACSSESGNDNNGSGGAAGAGSCVCDVAELAICGHRGTGPKGAFPENTIESLNQAVREGAELVELDVQLSADGHVVLMHDDTVERTTDGNGCVANLTLAELQALDAAVGTPLEGQGVRVPTLAETMGQVDSGLNIELKVPDDPSCPLPDSSALVQAVVAQIQADTKTRRIMVSSFDITALDQVKALDASIEVGFLASAAVTVVQDAVSHGFEGINILALVATPERVDEAHAAGLAVNVWTVNDEPTLQQMLDRKVDMVITDEPDLLLELRAARCSEQCP